MSIYSESYLEEPEPENDEDSSVCSECTYRNCQCDVAWERMQDGED
jgi:hypothetical protein